MKSSEQYQEFNHPSSASLQISACYLCGLTLDKTATPDHIIPTSLFKKGSGYRPQLPVHHKCNNAKSKDDKWAGYMIRLHSSLNKDAAAELTDFIKRAGQQSNSAYLVGKSKKIADYKLAKTIFGHMRPGLEIPEKAEPKVMLHLPQDDVERLGPYIRNLCRGLYMRNVPSATPPSPKLQWYPYDIVKLRGGADHMWAYFDRLMKIGPETRFMQSWGDRIFYCGNSSSADQNRGFILLEFFQRFTVVAWFDKSDS